LMKRLLIVGAGGHGRSVAEAACAAGQYAVVGFIDDVTEARQAWAWPVLGATSDLAKYRDLADAAIVAIGKNSLREKLCDQLLAANFELATVVHPR
ncbi:hypothetical protein WHJ73_14485, partial [Staphylococcus aureus]